MEHYIRKIFVQDSKNLIIQFLRYAIVGGISAVADISVFSLTANVFGINPLAANTISFTLGLLINYFLSRQWVFNRKSHEFKRDFLLFAAIGLIGLLISNLIIYILIDKKLMYSILYFLSDSMIKTSSKVIATFIVLFWNFFARKKIVF